MPTLKRILVAVAAALALAMALDYVTFAATGDSLILGQTNKANARTVIERTTDGAVLKLTTNSNASAPFVTNGTGKVDNLNADQLDGKTSSYFATAEQAVIAAGYVAQDGSLVNAWRVESSTWDAVSERYEITLSGVTFLYSNYAVTVTPTTSATPFRYNSQSGDLLIYFDGNIQSAFAFTVVALQ